jgi:hypothetical protein
MIYFAYELLPKLRHLTLSGVNEEGELEWIGTFQEWQEVNYEEMKMIWR